MSKGRQIREKISSVKSTQKITGAMELVAASKMRKAKERMAASKPYAETIAQLIGHVAKASLEYRHPYFTERPVKRVGVFIVSSDRGLCGGLNNLLFKQVLNFCQAQEAEGVEVVLGLVGAKAEAFFARLSLEIACSISHVGDQPSIVTLLGGVKILLDQFDSGMLDQVHLFANEFVNTIKQAPYQRRLLPIIPEEVSGMPQQWDYIYEPDARMLLDVMLKRYLESLLYQAVVENIACEQASRMVAMKNATDNASEMIDTLKLAFNKARQAAITQELAEICSGAAVDED